MSTRLNKQRLKQILSARPASVAIIFIAIIGRLIQIFYFFNIRVDASYQTIATKNFVAGHGISIDFVLPSDLSTIIYEPLIKWPPGFSLLLAPFYFLSGGNFIAAGIILHGLCAIALIFYSRAVLRLFEVPLYLVNASTIVTGFFIYPFYLVISSDAISTTFFIAGFYYILSLLKMQERSTRKLIIASACFLVCAWTKYLLVPVVFVIPAYLIVKGFSSSGKKIKRSGFILFLILFVGVSCLLTYQKYISGSATYVSPTNRGFFPQNLLESFPLFPAAFLGPDTLALLFDKPSIHNFILHLYQLVYLTAILFLSLMSLRFAKAFLAVTSLRKSYLLLSVFVSFVLLGVLAVLSVSTAKGQESPGILWTYVQEPRYYGPLILLFQLSLFIFYPVANNLKAVFYLLLLLLAIETFRGVVFDVNRIKLLHKEEYSWQYEDRFQKYADTILKAAEKKFSTQKSVVTGSSYFMNNRVSLYSRVPVLSDAGTINLPSSLQTQKPVLLFVIIHKKGFEDFRAFLSTQKEAAGKFDDFYFYTAYVQSH